MDAQQPADRRYCGRVFTAEEIGLIKQLIGSIPAKNRAQLSRIVCDLLGWLKPDGGRKDMSCRVAMLRMERDGLIRLPPPIKGNSNGRHRPRWTAASDPRDIVELPAGRLGELEFRPVATRHDSSLWNELIARHHYLGYKPLPGAQVRYFVANHSHLLAVLGFGASAWKVAPRDKFIGWTPGQRQANLQLVVNNARFLILPWIRCHNLASRILAGISRRLPGDWEQRYGYKPVLLETFVEQQRFRGTCYRAANWLHVGQTQGRGKLDRHNRCEVPVKDILLFPLHRKFRQRLCALQPTGLRSEEMRRGLKPGVS